MCGAYMERDPFNEVAGRTMRKRRGRIRLEGGRCRESFPVTIVMKRVGSLGVGTCIPGIKMRNRRGQKRTDRVKAEKGGKRGNDLLTV